VLSAVGCESPRAAQLVGIVVGREYMSRGNVFCNLLIYFVQTMPQLLEYLIIRRLFDIFILPVADHSRYFNFLIE
jgi:hypothetical protein